MSTQTFAPPAPPPPPPPSTPARTSRRSSALRLLMSAAVVLVGASTLLVASLAVFTNSAEVGGNTITAGSVDITASPATAALSLGGMAPGDQTTVPMTVSNTGTLELRYALVSTTTEDTLAQILELTVKTGVVTCDDEGWSATGTTVYAGPLGSVAGTALLGSPTPGRDAGDRVLAGGADETFCFNVTLPASTTAGEGMTTSATLEFLAEQTANNP